MSTRQSLDGHWDFLPLPPGAPAAKRGSVPPPDFEDMRIRVPGYWNHFPQNVGGDWGAYDHYRYPAHWQNAAAAWCRQRFQYAARDAGPDARTRLCFDGVAGTTTVWLNGRELGRNADLFLPFSFDVTAVVRREDENELLVRVDPPIVRDQLWHVPPGSWVGWHLRGIWQSVYLQTAPANAIDDVFCQPSVRQSRLTVEATLALHASGDGLTLQAEILDNDHRVLDLGIQAVPGGDSAPVLHFTADKPPLAHWSPESPRLYHARVTLRADDQVVDQRIVRFGFRELWIEGTQFRLNGVPLKLFGDSWHYMGVAQQNPAYARTWYDFARSCGANVIRTHAMPFPPCYFDVADEMGMLIIDESAIYGSAGTLAYDEPAFWENCRDHIRRLVRRDRNHPSIIAWSAVNETIWRRGDVIFPELLKLADVAREADPTRIVTFDENDSDIGGGAPTHGGHYGTPEHWRRVWQRDKPLMVHEFSSLYHGGPDNVSHLVDEQAYADYHTRLRGAGEEAADMFLRLRSLGAASITPWNLNWYALEPIPLQNTEDLPPGVTAGGPTFDRIGQRALTLNYGYDPDAAGWRPNAALEPLALCYRRQRFFLPRRPRQGFGGCALSYVAEIWNDVGRPATLELVFTLERGEQQVHNEVWTLQLNPLASRQVTLSIELPVVDALQTLGARLELREPGAAQPVHCESWPIDARPAAPLAAEPVRQAWLAGAGEAPPAALGATTPVTGGGLPCELLEDAGATLVLAGSHSGRRYRGWFEDDGVDQWIRAGGRLVVLPGALDDQDTSALAPLRRSCSHAYVRDEASPLLADFTNAHFRDWPADGTLATYVFPRPSTGPALCPLDSGDASEGLALTPLVIVPHGDGHVVLSGMDLLARATDTPAAAALLERLMHKELPPAPTRPVSVVAPADSRWPALLAEVGVDAVAGGEIVVADAAAPTSLNDPRVTRDALDRLFDAGGTLLLNTLTPETAAAWSQRLGVALELHDELRFNVARSGADPVLRGLNNFDFCWVRGGEKHPIARHTLSMDDSTCHTLVQTVATRWEDYQVLPEQCKVAAMYRRLDAFAQPRAVVVEIPRGKGRILVSQLLLSEAPRLFRDRARRILSRWLDVAGARRQAAVHPLAARARRSVNADGYILDWLVLGPFRDPQGQPIDHVFVDEADLRPAAGAAQGGCTWRRVLSPHAQVDLLSVFGELPDADHVAYAAVYVYSPRDRSILIDEPDMIGLLAGADGSTKMLLNGKPVGRFDFVRELVIDSDRVDGLPLRQGWNTLVIKLHNPSGRWRFTARLMTAAGNPAGDLQYTRDADAAAGPTKT